MLLFIYGKDLVFFSKNPLFNKKTNIYEMPFNRSIDIDDINDFNYVKFLMDKNK